MQMGDLERVVTDTAAAIDRHVMSTMLEKHSLAAHCTAIKRYLLLGQVRPSAATLPGFVCVLWGTAPDMPGFSQMGKGLHVPELMARSSRGAAPFKTDVLVG